MIGVHVVTDPLTAAAVATFMPGLADGLDESDPVDKLIRDRLDAFRKEGSGYLAIQNSRPQTIGYGLVDSPLLQLARIAEKVEEWTDLPVDRDQLLTTVSLYWFTGSDGWPRTPSTSRRTRRPGHAVDRAAGLRRVRRRRDGTQAHRPAAAGCLLDRVRARPALPGDGGPSELAADLQAFFAPLE